MKRLLALALLLLFTTVPSHAVENVEYHYYAPFSSARRPGPAPYGVPAEALVLSLLEDYTRTWAGPVELSSIHLELGCREGYKAYDTNDADVTLYLVAFVFQNESGAGQYFQCLANRRAEDAMLKEFACSLDGVEFIGHQHDMGGGRAYLTTFRLGNLVVGTIPAVSNGAGKDGMALACELAWQSLEQAREVTGQ